MMSLLWKWHVCGAACSSGHMDALIEASEAQEKIDKEGFSQIRGTWVPFRGYIGYLGLCRVKRWGLGIWGFPTRSCY